MMSKSRNRFLVALLCVFLSCAVLFGLTIVAPNTTSANATGTDFYVSGARIRTSGSVAGIKFNVKVQQSLYNSLISTHGEDAIIEFGAYVAPKDDVANVNDLNANFEDVLTIISVGNANSATPTKLSFSSDVAEYSVAVMYDITLMLEQIKNSELNPGGVGAEMSIDVQNDFLKRAFKMDLLARPFYSVNGEVLGYGDTTNGVRSMRAIMDAAVTDGYVEEDDPIVSQYIGEISYGSETAYYDVDSGELKGYEVEDGVTYAWNGKPVSVTEAQDVVTVSGVGEVESGADYYLSVFDTNSNVKRVPVKCVTVIDDAAELEAIFSSTETLSGYYMLGGNIDASTANLSGGIRSESLFTGTFNGDGYTISNLDVSGTSDNRNGSLFGKIIYPAVIENVGIENVTANYAAVISSKLNYIDSDWTDPSNPIALRPLLKNIYVKVADGSTDFRGIIAEKESQHASLPNIENVIVEALNCVVGSSAAQDMAGSFFGHSWFWSNDNDGIKNNYVISNIHLHNYWGLTNYATFEGVTRYETKAAMKTAGNNYSSFSNKYWDTTKDIPSWINTTIIVIPETDDTERAFDLNAKTLAVSDLGITQNDISAIEINSVKFTVENGVLPALTITASDTGVNKRVTLAGENLSYVVPYTDAVPAITVKLYTSKGSTTLTNVKVYSQVIDTEKEFETLFKTQANLDGVYALGDDIDATDLELSGAIRKDYIFNGIFDGCGYTISNLDVSGASDNRNGSLFGKIIYPAIIANVGFESVTADYAAVISSQLKYRDSDWTDVSNPIPLRPQLKNIYVKVVDGSTDFRGIIASKETQRTLFPVIENVIVVALNQSKTVSENIGSFFGSDWFKSSGDASVLKDNYVISNINLNHHWGIADYDNFTGVTRYETKDAMKTAGNEYSSFSDKYWEIVDGIPTWRNA